MMISIKPLSNLPGTHLSSPHFGANSQPPTRTFRAASLPASELVLCGVRRPLLHHVLVVRRGLPAFAFPVFRSWAEHPAAATEHSRGRRGCGGDTAAARGAAALEHVLWVRLALARGSPAKSARRVRIRDATSPERASIL